MKNYEVITDEQFLRFQDQRIEDHKSVERKQFLARNGETFLVADNRTGDFRCEEFPTFKQAEERLAKY